MYWVRYLGTLCRYYLLTVISHCLPQDRPPETDRCMGQKEHQEGCDYYILISFFPVRSAFTAYLQERTVPLLNPEKMAWSCSRSAGAERRKSVVDWSGALCTVLYLIGGIPVFSTGPFAVLPTMRPHTSSPDLYPGRARFTLAALCSPPCHACIPASGPPLSSSRENLRAGPATNQRGRSHPGGTRRYIHDAGCGALLTRG